MTDYTFGRFQRRIAGNILDSQVYHTDLRCQFLTDDGRIIELKASTAAEAAHKCREELGPNDRLMGYRWNDIPISPYLDLQKKLRSVGHNLSLDQIEAVMNTHKQLVSEPDFFQLYRKATGRGHMPENYYDTLSRWFKDPTRQPDVGIPVDNCVLAVISMKSNPSGRRVICPNGHTLAYTTARQIYYALTRKKHHGMVVDMPIHIKAREYLGGKDYEMRSVRVTKDCQNRVIQIGCQCIGYDAIYDLAKREGWDND